MIGKYIVKIPLYCFLSLCLLLPMNQTSFASQLGLIDLLPQSTNGDHHLFIETENQVINNNDISNQRLYSIDQPTSSMIFKPYFDDMNVNPTLRFPVESNDGAIHVVGEAGVGPSQEAIFSIEIQNENERLPLWTMTNGGTFDFTIPAKKGDTLYFMVQRSNDSTISGSYWKNVQIETTQPGEQRWTAKSTIQANQDPTLGQWTNTGLTVTENSILSIQGEGFARHGLNKNKTQHYSTTPDGKRYIIQKHQQTEQKILFDENAVVSSAPVGALIGTIQLADGTKSEPFMIGTRYTFRVPASGQLLLAYNDIAGNYWDNDGSYTANIQYYNEDANVTLDQPKDLLTSLEVSNDSFRLIPGKSTTLNIFAVYADGHKEDITKDKQVVYINKQPDILLGKAGSLKAGKNTGFANVTIAYLGKTTTISGVVSKSFPQSLKANPGHYTLKLGEQVTPSVDATFPDHSYDNLARAIEWVSDHPEIAEIQGGNIVANAPGTATITGNYYDMAQVKIQVTVTLNPLVRIQAVNNLILLSTNGTATNQIQGINQDKTTNDLTNNVTWSSANPAVADVQNGVINAHGTGRTVITANYYNLKTSFTVQVP